jgi:riboflavin kinase/FMN adenylyltransferase
MRIATSLTEYPADASPCVVAQGTFDGIHLGHQEVIRTAVARARDLGTAAVVLTFDRHPLAVLRPAEAPPEILPLDERLDRIADLGPDLALVIPFTLEFSRMEADAFVRDVLAGLCGAREIVVGFNHSFGRGARGTPELLRALAGPLGMSVRVIAPLTVQGTVVSSSAVRDALRRGDVGAAAALLGRPYALRGVVSRGAERGRTLGFPTANIVVTSALPLADGVYAGRAGWDATSAPAVVNVGVRPTFGGGTRLVETHLLDVQADLYGRRLAVAFLARIRGEMRFSSPDALRARIGEDVAAARRLLARAP